MAIQQQPFYVQPLDISQLLQQQPQQGGAGIMDLLAQIMGPGGIDPADLGDEDFAAWLRGMTPGQLPTPTAPDFDPILFAFGG